MSRTIEAAHGTPVRSILISWSAGQPPAPNTCVDPDGHLHRLYDMRQGGACLVRPDGYIGYRCGPANEDKLRDYLAKTFGIGIPAEAVLL